MQTVRTLITDDHGTIRKVLRAILDGYSTLEIVGEACNGEELRPDLVIMDVSMPRLDGLSAAELIKKVRPETTILIFSMHLVNEFIETAKGLGLDGFVFKGEGGTGLLKAVDVVLRGQKYFPPNSSAAGAD
jgi:DNA-binding NarL/FixJ family response regulator